MFGGSVVLGFVVDETDGEVGGQSGVVGGGVGE